MVEEVEDEEDDEVRTFDLVVWTTCCGQEARFLHHEDWLGHSHIHETREDIACLLLLMHGMHLRGQDQNGVGVVDVTTKGSRQLQTSGRIPLRVSGLGCSYQ